MGTPWNPSVEGLNHSGVFVCSFGLQRLRRICSIFEMPPKKIHWTKWVLFAFWPTGKKNIQSFFPEGWNPVGLFFTVGLTQTVLINKGWERLLQRCQLWESPGFTHGKSASFPRGWKGTMSERIWGAGNQGCSRCTSYVLDVWALDLCTGGLNSFFCRILFLKMFTSKRKNTRIKTLKEKQTKTGRLNTQKKSWVSRFHHAKKQQKEDEFVATGKKTQNAQVFFLFKFKNNMWRTSVNHHGVAGIFTDFSKIFNFQKWSTWTCAYFFCKWGWVSPPIH